MGLKISTCLGQNFPVDLRGLGKKAEWIGEFLDSTSALAVPSTGGVLHSWWLGHDMAGQGHLLNKAVTIISRLGRLSFGFG